MNNDEFTELINAQLDGHITDVQKARLDEHTESDSSARKFHDEFVRAMGTIDSLDEVNPPAILRKRILSAVPLGRHSAPVPSKPGWTSWLEPLRFRPFLRHAVTFGAGVAVAVIAVSAIGYKGGADGLLDNSDFTGTIMKTIDRAEGFHEIGSINLDLDGVHGEMSLHESEAGLVAEVSLESSKEIDWVLQYDHPNLH